MSTSGTRPCSPSRSGCFNPAEDDVAAAAAAAVVADVDVESVDSPLVLVEEAVVVAVLLPAVPTGGNFLPAFPADPVVAPAAAPAAAERAVLPA